MKNKKLEEVIDAAKTGIDLASNIEKCCDPNNKDKVESIVGIVGNSIILVFKICLLNNQICRENEFKKQMNSSLSTLGRLSDKQNPFYKEVYSTYYDIDKDNFDQIMVDIKRCIQSEFSADRKVMLFWNLITAKSNLPITDMILIMSY